MRMTKFNLRLQPGLLASAILCCVLAGCVVGPKYHAPATTPPPDYKESPANPTQKPATPAQASTPADPTLGGLGDWTVAQPKDGLLRGKWWEIYNQPELNALEEQLNINNQNIKQSFENFMAARAMVREARAQYFPTATVGANGTRSRGSSNLGKATSANGTAQGGATTTFLNCPPILRGSQTCGARFATRCGRHNIPRN